MKKTLIRIFKPGLLVFFLMAGMSQANAQTDMDAIMMNKKQFCNGFVYDYSSWDHYWEGKLKRNNQNLGTVSTQMVMLMSNYGITDNLNIMAGLPYIWTKASAGTLHGLKGIQDLSLFVKWRPLNYLFGKNKISLFIVGGVATPLSDYVIDYLPLTIGMGSTNVITKGMIDYRWKRFTVTASGAFIWRSNVFVDRTAYYDTEQHLTNQVKMPNAFQYQVRTGYRGKYLIAEALLTRWITDGGFDITRNNMPFPSNKMNASIIGAHVKYVLKKLPALSVEAGGSYVMHGRNVGQATEFNGSVFYIIQFGHSKVSASRSCKLCGLR